MAIFITTVLWSCLFNHTVTSGKQKTFTLHIDHHNKEFLDTNQTTVKYSIS